VHWFSLRHKRLLQSLKWLRREYEASPEYKSQERRSRRQNVVSSINIDAPSLEKGSNYNAGRNNVFERYVSIREGGIYVCRSMLSWARVGTYSFLYGRDRHFETCVGRFFDLEFEAKRAFASGQYAHLIARTLLLQRQRTDIPFLNYILKVSLILFS
jgi:hypothetical protein